MKTFKRFSVITLIACALISCGSSKKVSTNEPKEIDLKEVQVLAEKKPFLRAYGVGKHHKFSTAKNLAEAQALAELARRVNTLMILGTKEKDATEDQYIERNQVEGLSTQKEYGEINVHVESMTEAKVSGAVIIKTQQFKYPNGQYEIWVCMEYMGSAQELIDKNIRDVLSNEDQKRMKENIDNYEKDLKQMLEKMRK